MTDTQVIKYVQGITENKLVDQVDYPSLFKQVLQEFCAEHRFWWRKKNLTFQTAAATPTYDLTQIATVPVGAGVFVEEITSLFYIDSSRNVTRLEPVTDDEADAVNIADTVTTDTPSTWSPDTTDLQLFQTVRIGPIPKSVYNLRVYFWAMPNPDQASSDHAIYIVPKPLHHVLCTGLEKEIWRLAYGVQDPKYATAQALYDKKVAAARLKPSFWSGKSNLFINQDEEAVRATR